MYFGDFLFHLIVFFINFALLVNNYESCLLICINKFDDF